MYFSLLDGPIPVPILTNQDTQGQTKVGVDRLPRKSYTLGSLHHQTLFNVVGSIPAGTVTTTVGARFLLASRLKIPKIMAAVSALSDITGGITFNIVVGTGAYETGATAATGTFTITGVPLTTKDNVYTIGGTAVTAPQTTGNSVTVQAAADVLVINADPVVSLLVTATNTLGVVTTTAKAKGTAGNAITTTASSTAGGDTLTANQATLAGGTSASAIVLGANDNSSTSGVSTNPAPAGTALFAIDIPFTTTYFPFTLNGATTGITTANGGVSGSRALNPQDGNTYYTYGFIPTYPDQVFEAGTLLTLRANTPAGTGSVTNLIVSADMEIQPAAGAATFPAQRFPQASGKYPGIPFGSIDF